MPGKSKTSCRVRAVLTVLETLSEASLGAVRFRWRASALAYDPVAGLAESPSGRCDRMLVSLIDRLLEPVAEPTASELQPLKAKRVPVRVSLRPQGSAKRDAASTDHKSSSAGIASNADRRGRFTDDRSGRTAARVGMPVTTPLAKQFQDPTADSVAHILSRHDSLYETDARAGGVMNSVALKKRTAVASSFSPTSSRANSILPAARGSIAVTYRRRRVETSFPARSGDATHSRSADFNECVKVDSAKKRDSETVGQASQREPMHSAAAPKDGRFVKRRALDSAGDIQTVLGKSAMSRSGLSVPIEFDPGVSADRLTAWAYGAMRVEAPRLRVRSPGPTDTEQAVFTRDSANTSISRYDEKINGEHSRYRETDNLGTSLGTLGRLVHRWHEDQKGASRKVFARESTRWPVNALSLSDGPPSPELSTSTASDMDFTRRLENVLLRESRRHGIVVEDQ